MRGRHSLENADGTITTKFGARIIPYCIKTSHSGSVSANVGAFMAQPRMHEIRKQLEAAAPKTDKNDMCLLDGDGNFYLKSVLDRDGPKAKPVGQIDMALELDIFKFAIELHTMSQLHAARSREPHCTEMRVRSPRCTSK